MDEFDIQFFFNKIILLYTNMYMYILYIYVSNNTISLLCRNQSAYTVFLELTAYKQKYYLQLSAHFQGGHNLSATYQ